MSKMWYTGIERLEMRCEPKRPKRKCNPKFFTAAEAAKRAGLHRNTILWNIRQGYLRASYDGYKYRIDPRSLSSFRKKYYESAKEE